MSKSNMLLGLARGKVGDLVFYRDGGEQRTRTRVIPKNPRSPLQMAQRSKIANVSALYRALAPVVAESFTNRPSNQSGYNAFASVAIPAAPYLTKQMASADVVLPQNCQISKGVLQSLAPRVLDLDADTGFGVPLSGELDGLDTIGKVSAALMQDYPTLQIGDKILAVMLRFTPIPDDFNGVERYSAALTVESFVIDPDSSDLLDDTEFRARDGMFSTGDLSNQFDQFTQLAAFIVCRTDENGALQCSTEWARLSSLAQSLYDGYRTPASKNDAVESYMAGTESVLR